MSNFTLISIKIIIIMVIIIIIFSFMAEKSRVLLGENPP